VLGSTTVFAVPVEERLREKEDENRRKAVRRSLGLPEMETETEKDQEERI